MPVKLAVFDMAGTTVEDDNAVATAFRKAFELYGYTVSEKDVNPLMGYRKPVAIQMMLEKLNVATDNEMVDDIHREFEIEMIGHYENSSDVRPIPGAEEVLLRLKEKGIRIALNTGFSKKIANTIMNRLQWIEKGIADDYIASDEVSQGRPHPFMIRELMRRTNISDPMQVAKIGDTSVDIEEGKNAGCNYVIGVTTGAFHRDELEPFQPTHIVDSLTEIPALLI